MILSTKILKILDYLFEGKFSNDEMRIGIPCHLDETKSEHFMSIHLKNGLWKCDVCKRTGNLAMLAKEYTGMEYYELLKIISQ